MCCAFGSDNKCRDLLRVHASLYQNTQRNKSTSIGSAFKQGNLFLLQDSFKTKLTHSGIHKKKLSDCTFWSKQFFKQLSYNWSKWLHVCLQKPNLTLNGIIYASLFFFFQAQESTGDVHSCTTAVILRCCWSHVNLKPSNVAPSNRKTVHLLATNMILNQTGISGVMF